MWDFCPIIHDFVAGKETDAKEAGDIKWGQTNELTKCEEKQPTPFIALMDNSHESCQVVRDITKTLFMKCQLWSQFHVSFMVKKEKKCKKAKEK